MINQNQTIKAIVPRFGQIYHLILASNQVLPLPLALITKLHLSVGQNLSGEDYEKLSQQSFRFLLRESALRSIGISPQNETSLRRKLTIKSRLIQNKYKYTNLDLSSEIDHLLTNLAEQKLLSATSYAKHLVQKNSKRSLTYLNQLLRHQGLSQQEIYGTLKTVSPGLETDNLKKLLLKKLPRFQNLPKLKQKEKLLGLAYRNGFPLNLAKRIVDELLN